MDEFNVQIYKNILICKCYCEKKAKKDGARIAVASAVLQVFKGCSTVVRRINPLNNR